MAGTKEQGDQRAAAIEDLRVKRVQIGAELAARQDECRALPPHGYLTCQARYERLEARIEELDRKIENLARTIPSHS